MLRHLTSGALAAALAVGTLAAPAADAQTRLPASLSLSSLQDAHPFCGLGDVPQSEANAAAEALAAHRAAHGSTLERFGGFPTVTIPVAYHVVTGTLPSEPVPTEAEILAQNEHMNEAFEGTGFRFVVAHIGFTVNDDWYRVVAPENNVDNAAALEMKTALAISPLTTLNAYFTEFGIPLGGYAQFPSNTPESNPNVQFQRWGVINQIVSLPGRPGAREGDTMVHEVGHALQLYHTFQSGCHAEAQCASAGDQVCDTPAQASVSSIMECPGGTDTCPTSEGLDPDHNFMNYVTDACMTEFTAGQTERMHTAMALYRPTLYNASLSVSTVTQALDYGVSYIGFPEAQSLRLFNATDEEATIAEVEMPEGYMLDVSAPFTIEAGGSLEIEVTLDPQAEGSYAGSLVFAVEGGPSVVVALDGTARLAPDVAAAPRPVLVPLQPGQTAQAAFDLLNEGPGQLEWTADAFAGRLAAADAADAGPEARQAGGPDAFGYTWVDSRSPYGPAFAFDDIAGAPGAVQAPLGDDDAFETFLPFPFPFYGESYALASIISNGRIEFGDDISTTPFNTPIPRTSDPSGFLAPFWEDLDPSAAGAVWYKLSPEAAVVQWDGVGRKADPEARLTFQVVLYPDGRALFQYASLLGAAAREVIGVENLDGTAGLQVAAREAYAEEGLALLIAPPTALVTAVEPAAGQLAPGGSVPVALSVAAPAAQLPGTFVERVYVRSNDPDEAVLAVPVVVQVNPAGAPAPPAPIAPAYGADEVARPAALSWTATGAAGYDVEVATDEAFNDVVFAADDVAATAAAAGGLVPGATYYWHVRADAGGGSVSAWSAPYVFRTSSAVASEEGAPAAAATAIEGAYPNPASTAATVRFRLAEAGPVSLVAYDVLGQEVARLAAGRYGAGAHEATLAAAGLAPGVYVVRLVAGGAVDAHHLVITR